MRTFTLVLKLLAPVFFFVGGLHLALGAGADVLLGAKLSAEALADAALDSQNRFYGVAFTLYGLVLFVGASDPARYATMLRCALGAFFAAGLARFVSMALRGVPPPLVLGLFATELVMPPVLAVWLSRVVRTA